MLIFVTIGSIEIAAAQNTADDTDIRSWNDLQVSVPLTKKVDLYTVATIQFRDNLTHHDNSRFTVGAVFKATKQFSIAPFVTFLSVRNSIGKYRYEYRYSLRGVYRFPFKKVGISHRSQFEYRIRPGVNTWRYRPSITIEKPVPERFVKGLKAFITDEPFFDSAAGRFYRNRFSAGVNKELNKNFSVDLYYLLQNDSLQRPGTAHVIGTAWKVKF